MESYAFKLPDLGEGTAEAEITAWHVVVGDIVAEDQPLVDLMTDKATVEVPSPVAGTVIALYGDPGERRAVGSDLVIFDVTRDSDASSSPEALPNEIALEPPVEKHAAVAVDTPDKP